MPVDTARRVYRRYLKFEPGHAEEYIEFLKTRCHWDEVAEILAKLVNDETFQSLAGKSKHEMWLELCEIVATHPEEVNCLDIDSMIRGGIRKFTDEVGRLWTCLADFYIRRGLFEKARDIYEEGLATVLTVRDFSLIFDAYTQFEESVLSAKMEFAAEGTLDDETEKNGVGNNCGSDFLLTDSGDDLDLCLARLEFLLSRRTELLSSVMLRQNPHNVHEWRKRISLFEDNPARQVMTFTEAVTSVDPSKAIGKPHILWVDFAKFYEIHGDVENARVVLDKAVRVPYSTVDDLATVWCEWGELELRQQNLEGALSLMRQATTEPPRSPGLRQINPELIPVQDQLFKSLKLWTFYCDLEESLGSLVSAQAVYNRVLDLRIASPQIILNFALLLKENMLFEESYKVYERGINLFKFPHCREIWQAYLKDFVSRFGSKKLERARDLFEHCVAAVPSEESKPFFLEYARLEEEHGLTRRAMDIYERACKKVPNDEKLELYEFYVSRAMDAFGVGKVRNIYEGAIGQNLPDGVTKVLCTRYARLERKLGEVDRARSLYIHGSQFANPKQDSVFWEEWNHFEVRHGNEDTFREMLRIKRSVSASFSQMHFNIATSELPSRSLNAEAGNVHVPVTSTFQGFGAIEESMVELERGGPSDKIEGFVKARTDGGGTVPSAVLSLENPDEIEIGDEEAEEGGTAGQGIDVEQSILPDSLFSHDLKAEARDERAGALDRFKRQKL